ncbi:hypothetical protein PGT21_000859 [Puccinia graminis f. sp. tritici]|uniref:Chromo domain-containing protein n=1 Tax=Puccinia graminis f. sp. tritici TaxID=56615 RepID=A0A5B0QZW6_PUCGR|nr:hypothetical protein PGT21_000693 [Puccinia graminis f. sp. tritici]KAA1095554.1 hypothetical protein PGT21_000859 [Puccinia graminis f. sp. tritici]KAA1118314.1 hypothetical protein PGTUg99_002453 [Puccinia graminis f. sp. tritici]
MEWEAIEILKEKSNHYYIQWAGIDPQTNQAWKPTWEPKSMANKVLVRDWKDKQKKKTKKQKQSKNNSPFEPRSPSSSSLTRVSINVKKSRICNSPRRNTPVKSNLLSSESSSVAIDENSPCEIDPTHTLREATDPGAYPEDALPQETSNSSYMKKSEKMQSSDFLQVKNTQKIGLSSHIQLHESDTFLAGEASQPDAIQPDVKNLDGIIHSEIKHITPLNSNGPPCNSPQAALISIQRPPDQENLGISSDQDRRVQELHQTISKLRKLLKGALEFNMLEHDRRESEYQRENDTMTDLKTQIRIQESQLADQETIITNLQLEVDELNSRVKSLSAMLVEHNPPARQLYNKFLSRHEQELQQLKAQLRLACETNKRLQVQRVTPANAHLEGQEVETKIRKLEKKNYESHQTPRSSLREAKNHNLVLPSPLQVKEEASESESDEENIALTLTGQQLHFKNQHKAL